MSPRRTALVLGLLLLLPVGSAHAERRFDPRVSAHSSALPRLPGGTILRTTVDSRISHLRSIRPPRSFLGFSFEYPQFPVATGGAVTGHNPLFEQLLRTLGQYGGGVPSVRVGGESTDDTFWNPDGKPRPPAINHSLSKYWLVDTKEFARRTGAKLILGLNLLNRDASIATDWASAAQEALGRQVLSYELGNEPELYGIVPRVFDAKGTLVPGRPRHYYFSQYVSDFARRAQYLRRRLPGLPLSGIASEDASSLPAFLPRNGRSINVVTLHYYVACTCNHNRRNPGYPSVAHLLSPHASISFVGGQVLSALAQARRYHLGVRFTEVGSVAGGGGELGPSFASALWGADFMLGTAAVGVRGVNFHTSGTYTPFYFGYDNGWLARVNPIYYAMLFFARTTANHARFLPDATVAAQKARNVNSEVWATVDPRGTVRVAILNKDLRRGGMVQIKVPHGGRQGSIERLQGPSARSSTGVTLAGQQFAAPTSDAQLVGTRVASSIRRGAGHTFKVFMPRTSAAILTVPRG